MNLDPIRNQNKPGGGRDQEKGDDVASSTFAMMNEEDEASRDSPGSRNATPAIMSHDRRGSDRYPYTHDSSDFHDAGVSDPCIMIFTTVMSVGVVILVDSICKMIVGKLRHCRPTIMP